MIEESGQVTAVSGDLAEVECERRSACGSCSVHGSCGTSLLERFFGRKSRVLTVSNPIGARPGERVVIGVEESTLLGAAFAAYLLPLLVMMAGALAAVWLAGHAGIVDTDPPAALGGLLGLVLGLWWLSRHSAQRSGDSRLQAVILRRTQPLSLEVSFPGWDRPDDSGEGGNARLS